MDLKVIKLTEGQNVFSYIEYAKGKENGNDYVLLLLREFMAVVQDSLIDTSELLKALTLYQVKNDSYLQINDDALKERIYRGMFSVKP
jgi:hypothetical protein